MEDSALADKTTLPPENIIRLLELSLKCTYVGQYYQQIHGAAMGSPVSPIVCSLYMEAFERAFATAPPPPHDSGRDMPMAPALNSKTAPSLARSPRIRVFELLLARAREIGVSPGRVTPSSSRSPISRPRAQTHSKPLFSNLWQSKGLFCSLHLH